ncbi:MAG: hypothetical protein CMK08_12580 [Ponticaulis sp.]|nr:hypothetical protein [Ponticaulis sp.]
MRSHHIAAVRLSITCMMAAMRQVMARQAMPTLVQAIRALLMQALPARLTRQDTGRLIRLTTSPDLTITDSRKCGSRLAVRLSQRFPAISRHVMRRFITSRHQHLLPYLFA